MKHSSPVAQGMYATSAQHNRLRRDILQHTHDGSESARVSHNNLEDGGVSVDTTYSHADIDDHIDDNVGVHGGGAAEWVGLTKGSQLKILTGDDTFNIAGLAYGDNQVPIDFSPHTFLAAPRIFLQQYDSTIDRIYLRAADRAVDGFTAELMTSDEDNIGQHVHFHWMAIGQ